MADPGKLFGVSKSKLKNFAVAGSLTSFVASVYVYTMKAVGGTDELQAAVETFEREKAAKDESSDMASNAS